MVLLNKVINLFESLFELLKRLVGFVDLFAPIGDLLVKLLLLHLIVQRSCYIICNFLLKVNKLLMKELIHLMKVVQIDCVQSNLFLIICVTVSLFFSR